MELQLNTNSKTTYCRKWAVIALAAVIIILLSMLTVLFYFVLELRHNQKLMADFSLDSGKMKRSTFEDDFHAFIPGLEAMQFIGKISVLLIGKNGTIGPWVTSNSHGKCAKLDRDSSLRILQGGMYFIYAQMYYLTNETSNSFSIRRSREKTETTSISVCSNQPLMTDERISTWREISCYTGAIAQLQTNDTLTLHQIEQSRMLLLSPGYSHWGLIKLQSTQIEL